MDDDQSVNLQQFLTKTNADIGAKGVTFDNSFVNYSLCCPSRSTMLTGQYAHNHGVRGNQLPSGGYSKLAPTLGNTLPVWLQRAGYYTAHIGKFLNGYGATSPDTEVPPGWNEWYGSIDNPDEFTGGTYTAYGYTLNENGQIVHYGTTPDAVDPATYQTDVYSQKAADFIRRRAPSNKPFYLSVAPRDPHAEAASCNCAGDNPRAAPRYEGHFAGLDRASEPRLQRGRRLGQALQHQEPATAEPGRHQRGRRSLPRPRGGGAGRRRSRPERGQHAQAAGRAEKHGAHVHLRQRFLPRRAPGAAGEGAPLRALDPGAAPDPRSRECRRACTAASPSGTST